MIESRKKTIEIQDFEYVIFKGFSFTLPFKKIIIEFLRFIYYEEVDFHDDVHLAIKLLGFADKYVQHDLYERCMNFLTYNINFENAHTIFGFALQQNFPHLQGWCLKSFLNNLTVNDIYELIKQQKDHQEFSKVDPDLRDNTIRHVIKIFQKTSLDQKVFKLSEAFLIDNLNCDTIFKISNFIYGQNCKSTAKLKGILCDFAKENFQDLKDKRITRKFPRAFLEDLISCLLRSVPNIRKRPSKPQE